MGRYTDRNVLVLLAVLATAALVTAWFLAPPSNQTGGQAAWVAGLLVNLGAGVVGSAVTFFLIDLRLNRKREEAERLAAAQQRREDAEREDARRRQALLAAIRSQDVGEARGAVEELRIAGWLSDGSLCDVDLSGADLQGINMSGAKLAGAIFRGADLRGTDFTGADLSRCVFDTADLRGWVTTQAQLTDARFVNVTRS